MRRLALVPLLLVACEAAAPAPSPPPEDSPSPPASTDGGAAGARDAGTEASTPRLPDAPLPPFTHAVGSGLKVGVVTGRIYDDLAMHVDERMRDLAVLGVRAVRLEIEQATPMSTYAAIVRAAKAYGIEVLALVTQNTIGGADPMAGTRADFDGVFVPKVLAAVDAISAALPDVRYVEIWNEPDVYAFQPFYSYANGSCTGLEGAHRFALLTVRVFEALTERRKKNVPTPTMVAFDFSHQDDTCVIDSVLAAQPIVSHRAAYRPANGLADGLPTDVVSIHGYGQANRIPGESGYTYAGGTFADGVDGFLARVPGDQPVWYTEVGFCLAGIGGTDPLARQAKAVGLAFDALRTHPRITAAFSYSYRDDEGAGERCGLRDNSTTSYAPHPSYTVFQDESTKGGDVVAPAGTLAVARAGGGVIVTARADDADRKPPRIEIAVDAVVVADGPSPFHGTIAVAPGTHEIAARATDATGNARVIGRALIGGAE